MAEFSHIALAGFFASVVLCLGLAIYNAFLHPLRSYPGPKWIAMTPFPQMLHKTKGDLHIWFLALHLQYGPVVRVAPNDLSYIQPEAWNDIYGHRIGGKMSFQKDPVFFGPDFAGHLDGSTGIIRANDVNHARQRRLVSAGFSDRALREQEPLLRKYVDILVEKLRDGSASTEEGKINVVDWYNFTTFDITADLTFGRPLELLEKGRYSDWVRSIFASIKIVVIAQNCRKFPGLEKLLLKLIPRSVVEKRKKHEDFSKRMVDKRLEMKTDRPDIWTYVLRYADSPENKDRTLTRAEMYSNAATFMIAGSETTATLLSGLTYLLLTHPKKMECLLHEIRGAFSTKDDITLGKLTRLEYLNACVEEALRFYPPVATGMPRQAPPQGAVVGGKFVPGGTIVSIPQYAAYHNASNFKNCDSFIPERFLPEGKDEFQDDKKQILQPFSYGPRNCLGKNLAYHEIRLVISNILYEFDVSLCDQPNWLDQKTFVVWEKGPLWVKLTPRQNVSNGRL